ncbi:MAG: phytoene desaturase family protein [Anaerolineales bacterium]|jgi:phytoene desaturase|nr:phytoene desaturase family protein [Anaerolineales bacterium]
MKAIVIGSGFGGLGVANRLASKGHEVELFDKRDKLGGRAYQYEINGFKFDGGPTVITAPYMFDELFEAAGKKREDYINLVPLDPFYRIFDHEGKHFDYRLKIEDTLKEIERWNAADQQGYIKFDEQTRAIFDRFHPFTDQAFMTPQDMLRIVPDVIRLKAFLGYYGFTALNIKDPFLRRVFSFHPLLIGGNPFDTPSIFSLIVQFERKWGVHYAIGGTGAIVDALGRLFVEQGGKVHLSTEVKEILVEGRKATGIRLADGSVHKADIIISNGDVAHTYRYLIPEQYRRKYTNARIDRMKYSMSLFVIYFGTKRQYRDTSVLKHHNIILNQRYKGLLADIFNKNVLPEDFSLYLHMPTITDPSIAPEGAESFYVLSCVPTLESGTDWTKMARPYRDRVMQFLEDNYLPDLQANIVAEHYIDPLHFQNTLNSYRGAAFSVRPTLLQEAYFRPHNRSEEFENLYFVGAGTHPGAGVPAVLSSGKIAANLIDPSPASFAQRTDIDQELANLEPTARPI